ncbi:MULTISPECIES: amino acid ABC transporter ATP-binding/permease protein [Bartonella]|uniref:amino acid ABC transporter ATP-binding/permease protein n=1 Tax=Bartonella TaxID=773 RepID=UPI0018DB04D7|nr:MULTISPECIES: ATP-binding cassette domain-containing protein [Bartonella]MBI0170651.1 ATP-binding cassette domain-containing protein [Bartonella sp. W8167]MBI0175518.1 ATP-binding cassette domain-containing protein [Bartonella apis]
MKKILALIAPRDRIIRKKMLSGLVFAILTALSTIGLLCLSGWFITATGIAGLTIAATRVFDVFMPSAAIRFFALLRTGARYAERLVNHDATFMQSRGLRLQLFKTIAQRKSLRDLAMRPARLLHRLTGDIDSYELIYLKLIVPSIVALVAILTIIAVLSSVHLGLGLGFGLIVFATVIIFSCLSVKLNEKRSASLAIRRESLRTRVIALLSGQTDLVMNGCQQSFTSHVMNTEDSLATSDVSLKKRQLAIEAISGFVDKLIFVGLILSTILLYQYGLISLPLAVLSILAALTLYDLVKPLYQGCGEIGRYILALRRLSPFAESENANLAKTREELPPCSYVAIADIKRASYEPQLPAVLNDIHFTVSSGEKIAFVGPNGAGKSSLISLFMTKDMIVEGKIAAIKAALLEQNTYIFHDTLHENLKLANVTASNDDMVEAMERAGLHDYLVNLKDGLYSSIGENQTGLSTGQARRFALARLFLQKRDLWLLDEPTENIDSGTARDILERMKHYGREKSWLLVTHLKREATCCDRIITLDHTRITGDYERSSENYQRVLESLREDNYDKHSM